MSDVFLDLRNIKKRLTILDKFILRNSQDDILLSNRVYVERLENGHLYFTALTRSSRLRVLVNQIYGTIPEKGSYKCVITLEAVREIIDYISRTEHSSIFFSLDDEGMHLNAEVFDFDLTYGWEVDQQMFEKSEQLVSDLFSRGNTVLMPNLAFNTELMRTVLAGFDKQFNVQFGKNGAVYIDSPEHMSLVILDSRSPESLERARQILTASSQIVEDHLAISKEKEAA